MRLTEIDRFGRVHSAVWLHETNGRSEAHSIILTTVADLCPKYRELVLAADTLDQTLADLDSTETFCTDLAGPAEGLGAAAAEVWPEGSNYLVFAVRDGSDEAPRQQRYAVGDTEQSVSGELQFVAQNPFGSYLDWDVGGDASDYCGAGLEVDFDEAFAVWILAAGDLDVEAVEAGVGASGAFEGEIEDGDGYNAGEARFRFDAEYCEVGPE